MSHTISAENLENYTSKEEKKNYLVIQPCKLDHIVLKYSLTVSFEWLRNNLYTDYLKLFKQWVGFKFGWFITFIIKTVVRLTSFSIIFKIIPTDAFSNRVLSSQTSQTLSINIFMKLRIESPLNLHV